MVMQNASEEEQQWIMLSENLQRKDLSEVEKADQIAEILSGTEHLTPHALSKKLGIDNGYVYRLLDLHGYPSEVKQMVKSEEVSAKAVRPLSQLNSPGGWYFSTPLSTFKNQLKTALFTIEFSP